MNGMQPPKRKPLRPDQYQWAKDNGYSDDELRAQGYDPPADFSGVQAGSSTTAPLKPMPKTGKVAAAGRGLMESLLFGGSDEAAAALSFRRDEDAPLSELAKGSEPGGSTAQRYKQFKASREQAQADQPGAYLGGELTGLAASMALPLGAAKAAPTLVGRALRAGGTGLGIGATSGALSADGGLAERAKGAALGGAIGGLGGAAASPIIEGVARAPAAVLAGVGAAGGALMGDSPMDRLQKAAIGGALLGGPKTIAATARSIVSPRFSAGDVLRTVMGKPPIKAPHFAEELAKATGIKPTNVPKELATMRVDQLAQSSPEYQALWAQHQAPVDDPLLVDMIQQSPTLRDAKKRAINTMREFKLPVSQIKSATGERTVLPTPQMLHFMKMEVDKDIAQLVAGKVRPGQSTNIAAKTQTLNTFRDYIEQAVPGYAEANATFAASSAKLKALQQGAKAWPKSADEIEFMTQGMAPEELEAFRTGLASHVYKRINDSKPGSDVLGSLLGTEVGTAGAPDKLRRLRVLFPDEASYRTFEEKILRQKRDIGAKTIATQRGAAGLLGRTPLLMQALTGQGQ